MTLILSRMCSGLRAAVFVVLGTLLPVSAAAASSYEHPLDMEVLRGIYPEASRADYRREPFPYYAVYGTKDASPHESLLGYAFLTNDLAPEIVGYSGPIVVLVGVDPAVKIQALKVLEHSETSSYAYGITQDWWLKQFIGRGPDSPLKPDEDIDAISSATVSVTAICRSIKKSLETAAGQLADQLK